MLFVHNHFDVCSPRLIALMLDHHLLHDAHIVVALRLDILSQGSALHFVRVELAFLIRYYGAKVSKLIAPSL